ncbi:MAG TPA: hypothetical protein QGG18_09200 [Rhodospirillales bacterium]|nr:hypothetical protein [Rhodospirillales bacterium]
MDIKKVVLGDGGLASGAGLSITAVMEKCEFKQLGGDLENLRLFSLGTVNTQSSIVKTGARNSHAKYFLFPACLRRNLEASRFEMGRVTCGTFEQDGDLYVIYGVPAKGRKTLDVKAHETKAEGLLKTG